MSKLTSRSKIQIHHHCLSGPVAPIQIFEIHEVLNETGGTVIIPQASLNGAPGDAIGALTGLLDY